MNLIYKKSIKLGLIIILLGVFWSTSFLLVQAASYDYDPYNQTLKAPDSYYGIYKQNITALLPAIFQDRHEESAGVVTTFSYQVKDMLLATGRENIFLAVNLNEEVQSATNFAQEQRLVVLIIGFNAVSKQYEVKNYLANLLDPNLPAEALALSFSNDTLYLATNIARKRYNWDIINPLTGEVIIPIDTVYNNNTMLLETTLLTQLTAAVQAGTYNADLLTQFKFQLDKAKRQEYPIYMYHFDKTLYSLSYQNVFGLNAHDTRILDETFTTPFKPVKIASNTYHNILYVISEGSKLGLLGFDRNDGTFIKFVGSNKIELSLAEKFWRKLANKNLLDQADKKVQANFSDLAVDENGFIYTATATSKNAPIQRFNAKGENILKSKHKSVTGDYKRPHEEGYHKSKLSLIDVSTFATFIAYDQANGRLFSYNNSGEILFIYGASGASVDAFSHVQGMKFLGDDIIFVDRKDNDFYLKVITPTQYGKLINASSKNYASGNYDQSYVLFKEMLKQNSNSYYAHIGLGKIYYLRGEYQKACQEYKLGYSTSGYAEAYAIYRNAKIKENVPLVGAITFFTVVLIWSVMRLVKKNNEAKN